MLVKNIAKINPKPTSHYIDYINYIDTSSVNDGELSTVTYLDSNFPSRAQREVFENDILISSVRPRLKHNYFVSCKEPHLIASTGFVQVRVNSNLYLPQYVYYYLTSEKQVVLYDTIANSSQTTFPTFNKDVIESLEIPTISIDEQRHIVNTIGSVDDLIEKYEVINDKIDAFLKLLFTTRDEPNISLDSICTIKYGKSFEASKLSYKFQYPVYGGNGIIGTLDTYMFKESKVSISCRGAASGNVCLTQPLSSISSNSLYLDDIESKHVLPLFYYLKQANLYCYRSGSAQPQITIENIKSLKIPKSIFDIRYEKSISELYFKNIKKMQYLKNIKEILLSKYF